MRKQLTQPNPEPSAKRKPQIMPKKIPKQIQTNEVKKLKTDPVPIVVHNCSYDQTTMKNYGEIQYFIKEIGQTMDQLTE